MARSRTELAPRIVLVSAVVVGVLVLIAALVGSWWSGTALDQRGRPATAEVLSVWDSKSGAVTARVRFTTEDGEVVTTTTRPDELVDPPPAVGSTMPVVYDPGNPRAEVRDPRAPRETPAPPLLVAGAGVVFLGFCLAELVRRRRARRARATRGDGT